MKIIFLIALLVILLEIRKRLGLRRKNRLLDIWWWKRATIHRLKQEIKKGANIYEVDEDTKFTHFNADYTGAYNNCTYGLTPIDIACEYCSDPLAIQELINLGIDPNDLKHHKNLLTITSYRSPDLIEVLLKNGTDPNLNNGEAIFSMVYYSNFAAIKLCYKYGANFVISRFNHLDDEFETLFSITQKNILNCKSNIRTGSENSYDNYYKKRLKESEQISDFLKEHKFDSIDVLKSWKYWDDVTLKDLKERCEILKKNNYDIHWNDYLDKAILGKCSKEIIDFLIKEGGIKNTKHLFHQIRTKRKIKEEINKIINKHKRKTNI